jgi:hypothetical protein
MKKLKAQSVRNPTAQLKRAALVRADDEARRIPWQRLQKTASNTSTGRSFNSGCGQFSRLKAVSDWLIEIVNDRCPQRPLSRIFGKQQGPNTKSSQDQAFRSLPGRLD